MKTALFAATLVGATSIAALSIYLSRWKKDLASKVTHSSERGRVPSSTPINIKTIPDDVFTPQCFSLYDCATQSVSRRHLPDLEPSQLLTLLLRRNMSKFASFPQTYLIRLAAPAETRASFDRAHIETLNFNEGDLICNAYRVLLRTENKVEFEFLMGVSGRLVFSLESREEDIVFYNETLMWREANSKTALPLERRPVQWLHEITAWWMLDSGMQYLKDMKEKW